MEVPSNVLDALKVLDAYFKGLTQPPVATTGDFEKVFPWIIKWEGSDYENVPGDPGGPTKYGIDSRSHPGVDIHSLTLESAKAIYQSEWEASYASSLVHPLNVVYFNFHVNTGEGAAAKFLQQVLGVQVDGGVGPITKAAVATIKDPEDVATQIVHQADLYYEALAARGMGKFLKGWLNRNADLRKTFLS